MSILITVAAWNRKKVTDLSLYITNKYKGVGNKLVVYNDHSTDYDNDFLSTHTDEVIMLPSRMGIDHLRLYQMQQFLDTPFKYLYLTDNDVVHDPGYIPRLLELYYKYYGLSQAWLPVCLYNSPHSSHSANTIRDMGDLVIRQRAPGVSLFFNRAMVKKIMQSARKYIESPNGFRDKGHWDNVLWELLESPCIISSTSYVEHFGASGLHNGEGFDGMDSDRALNPTLHLEKNRGSVINYLLLDGTDPRELL